MCLRLASEKVYTESGTSRCIRDEHFNAVKKPEFVGLIRQLCKILRYLHMHKILHNDIKCDNVVIYRDGDGLKCILIDFRKACKIEEGKHKK